VLRAAAKTNTTPEEIALMHRLAKMSEVERQHLIDDFLDDTFGDTDANPELIAMLRAMRPELPAAPEPDQVEAWVELAELVQDLDFRASVRRMAEYQAAERDAGDRTGLHHDLSNYVRERVAAALTAGIDPGAAPILDDLVERYAATFQTTDTPKYRNALLRRLEIANDPRTERYINLLHVINGWPTQPSLSPIFDWFTCALRSHASSSRPGSSPGRVCRKQTAYQDAPKERVSHLEADPASETSPHRPPPNGLTARIELLSMPANFSTHHWPRHRNPLTPGLQVPTSCIRPIHRFRRLRMPDRARMLSALPPTILGVPYDPTGETPDERTSCRRE
jgi:hypothetical protein